MDSSSEKLRPLHLTIQESLNKLTSIDTKLIISQAQDVLGDQKAKYLIHRGQKTKLEIKYNLPDTALANVAAFAPHFYAIATASKNALPQICSKIFENKFQDHEDLNDSYITRIIGDILLGITGIDLADTYEI